MSKSYAYLTSQLEIKKWKKDKTAETLDFISSSLNSPKVKDLPNLKQFRASFCQNLTTILFENLPNLVSIDLSFSAVENITIKNCPNLKALDITNCSSLKSFADDSLNKLEYLAAFGVNPSLFHPFPSLKYLCIAAFADVSLANYFPVLEVCYFLNAQNTEIHLSEITKCQNLTIFTINKGIFIFDKLQTYSRLCCLDLSYSQIQGDPETFDNLIIIKENDLLVYNSDISSDTLAERITYRASDLLLYGPYLTPSVDFHEDIPKLADSNPYLYPRKPNEVEEILDEKTRRVFYTILGSSVMDMMGIGVQGQTKKTAIVQLVEPFDITWSHPSFSLYTAKYPRGYVTDNTNQTMILMKSLIKCPQGDIKDFCERLADFKNKGIREHNQKTLPTIDKATTSVLSEPDFLNDPINVSKRVYEKSNQEGNGALVRAIPIGIFCFWNEEMIVNNAIKFTQATHYAPACVFSCICVSLLISRFINFPTFGRPEHVDKTVIDSIKKTPGLKGNEKLLKAVRHFCSVTKLSELQLGTNPVSNTLKTCGAAVWCAKYSKSFEDGMIRILKEAGDASTNGSIVGAVLGAKFGVPCDNENLLRFMFNGPWIHTQIKMLLKIMGLKLQPFSKKVWIDQRENNEELRQTIPLFEERCMIWADEKAKDNVELVKLFKAKGIRVHLVRDTEVGVEMFLKKRNRTVLLLTTMERTENKEENPRAGIEFIEKIREIDSDIPVYLFSQEVFDNPEEKEEAMSVGCTDVLNNDGVMALAETF